MLSMNALGSPKSIRVFQTSTEVRSIRREYVYGIEERKKMIREQLSIVPNFTY